VRTLIDIPDDQIAALAEMGQAQKKSRAALVRESIGRMIADYREQRRLANIDAAFGIWNGQVEDGLEYQRRLRSEWDEIDERIEQRLSAAGE
jgi:hypothetical protein